jgi:hypothetical protein
LFYLVESAFEYLAIMPKDLRPPSRSKLLTNPAAEYLETRGSDALGVTPTETAPVPEFVPEIDQFVPYGLLAE